MRVKAHFIAPKTRLVRSNTVQIPLSLGLPKRDSVEILAETNYQSLMSGLIVLDQRLKNMKEPTNLTREQRSLRVLHYFNDERHNIYNIQQEAIQSQNNIYRWRYVPGMCTSFISALSLNYNVRVTCGASIILKLAVSATKYMFIVMVWKTPTIVKPVTVHVYFCFVVTKFEVVVTCTICA